MPSQRRFRQQSLPIEPLERRQMLAFAVDVVVNTNETFQTVHGMGAAMMSGDWRPEYSDPAFFDRLVGDLGTTAVRAAILPTAEIVNDDDDPNHFNWAGFDSKALAHPFTFFQKMKDRGVDKFITSVWTAPAWMKTNQMYTDGGSLRPDMYEEFAEYLAAVVKLAKDDYGIDLYSISVQNEPYFVEPYESTTYNANQLHETLRAVGRKFAREGITTRITLPEDLIFADRMDWYAGRAMNDPETKNYVGAFSGHALTDHWEAMRDRLAPYGKEFWQTETSGNSASWEGAIGVATTMFKALDIANASAFLYWQYSDKAGSDKSSLMTDGQPNAKYYAAKHFYRYIRPGYVHVADTSSSDQILSTTFKDPKTGALTIALMNRNGDFADINFSLAGSNLPGSYKVFRSTSQEKFVSLGTITGGSNFKMSIPGSSIIAITNAPELTAKTGGAMPTTIPPRVRDFVFKNNFFLAAMKGYNNSVTAQIAGGANVNQTAFNGWKPIHSAAGSAHGGSIDTLKTLIAAGGDIHARTNDGWTPLHAAAANTFIKFKAIATLVEDKITTLLDAGADINARDNAGRTPLMWAAMMGKVILYSEDAAIVQTLLDRGADPFLKDNAGKTALDYAEQMGYVRIADALIKKMGIDRVSPRADVSNVTPDPRSTGVSEFFINFTERVTGFDVDDIVLTRDGVVQTMPGGSIITSDNERNYRLSNPAGIGNTPGTWTFTVKAAGSGITDISGNPFLVDAGDEWVMTANPPPPPPPTGPQTPYKGTAPAITNFAPTFIELEDYDLGGEGVAYHDADANNIGGVYRTDGVDLKAVQNDSGGYYVGYTKAGEWTEYTVNVVNAGTYNLDIRYASSNTGGTFHIEVDGANVTGPITASNTGGWQSWKTITKSGVTLAQGQHIIRLALDSLGPNGAVGNFNYLKIAPPTSPPPPPPPPPPPATQTPFTSAFQVGASPVTIEAENFDNGGEGVAYHDTDSTNSGGQYRATGVDIQATIDTGGGYNIGYTRAGEWLEYTLSVTTTGTYDLTARVASTAAGGTFHFEIDGANVSGSLSTPNTGGWQTFTNVSKTGVNLTAGTHILRLALDAVGTNNSVGNFNYITIAPATTAPAQSPFKGTPFQVGPTPVTIQVEDFDNGGQGIAYNDSTPATLGAYRSNVAVDIGVTGDIGGGYDVGFVTPGEWLEYTIDVTQAGVYQLDFRVASKGLGGKFRAHIDGIDYTGALQVPDTGAWATFTTFTRPGLSLPAGQHVLRLAFDSAGGLGFTGNFNWMKITRT